jgi:hypothetical protein
VGTEEGIIVTMVKVKAILSVYLIYTLCHESILGSGSIAPGINLGAR